MTAPETPSIRDLSNDPHPWMHRLRSTGSIAWVPAISGWVVSGYDAATQVLRDDETFTVDDPRFATAKVVGQSMLSVDGQPHGLQRRAFDAPFRRRSSNDLRPLVQSETDSLIDGFIADGSADLRTQFAGPLAATVIMGVLGLRSTAPDTVLGWYRSIVDAVERIEGGQSDAHAGEAMAALTAALGNAGERHQNSRDAFEALPPHAVASNVAVVMFGAIETVEGAISNGVWHLLTEPGLAEALERAETSIESIVEECLRIEPAAAFVDRYATRPVDMDGVEISKGDFVTVAIHGANRDPAQFDRPDEFIVNRPNANTHLSFAVGPHACLGLHLARLEMSVAIETAIRRLPDLALIDLEAAKPRGHIFRKPAELAVRWRR